MSWQRVRGHEAVVRTFEQAIRRDRLAHAYLFTGPSGVGKRRFAEELAKALLCEGRTEERLESCDRCPACLQIAAGTHPDYYFVSRPEDTLELPIKIVRELIGDLGLKPARGRGKVAVLDDADDLNDESANCFLKTLEEPPPRSLLILIGTSSERQLATIVSRCQVIHFAPLAPALIADLLREQGQEDAALIERLVHLSGGSVGQALALAEPALWEFRRTLVAGLVVASPDSVALAQQWMRFVEEAGKDAGHQRRRAALVLRLLIEFFSNALNLSIGGTPRTAEPGDLPALRELAQRCGPDHLLALLERCLQGDVQIDRRVQLVLVLEALLDALGKPGPNLRSAK